MTPDKPPHLGEKQSLREAALALRQKLDMVSLSQAICARLAQDEAFLAAPRVLTYAARDHEVDMSALFQARPEKAWYFPRVTGVGSMRFGWVTSLTSMVAHPRWGILEPEDSPETQWIEPDQLEASDWVLVPVLMADTHGNRLGFGGGFYDRFLAMLPPAAQTICPLPESQRVELLPADPWDIPVKMTVTEAGIYVPSRFPKPVEGNG